MALINITYNEQYFRGSYHSETAPGGYDNYWWNSYLTDDSSVLANKFVQKALTLNIDLTGKKVLVLGCAYGFLVKFLLELGVDAYGMDISEFAISQLPELSGRLLVGDMRLDADYQRAKTLAGLTKKNDVFDMIIDEDCICCFTDSEAVTVCTLMKSYSSMAVHLVDVTPNLINWYNLHTLDEWRVIVGTSPKEKWYTRYLWSET